MMKELYNIFSIFERGAALNKDRIAIIEGKEQVSYGALNRSINQTVSYFKSQGIEPGDRVLVFVPMGIDLYRIVLALYKMGATAVFLDEWVNVKRLKVCCELANCRAIIAVRKVRIIGWFIGAIRKIPIKLKDKVYAQFKEDTQTVATPADQAALITFTTGSTGVPKAALRTNAFLKEQFDALQEEINPRAGEVDMTTLPIVLLINLGVGATSIIAKFSQKKPAELKVEDIVQQLEMHKVNRITASPYFLSRIAKQLLKTKHQLADLNFVFTGGAPVFPKEARLFGQAFPQTSVKIAYGSTEAEPISLIDAKEVARSGEQAKLLHGLPVGQAYHKTKTKIIRWEDKALVSFEEVKRGTVGEIIVAGPHVLKQYYNNETAFKANKIVLADDTWHRTGDSGFIGDYGAIYLTGRCKTLFYHQEQMICPFLVEDFLLQQDGVTMGTILQKGDGVEFVLEAQSSEKSAIEEAIAGLGIRPFSVRYMSVMPRDPRHHSKIDYGKL